jgi:hypothetical protein
LIAVKVAKWAVICTKNAVVQTEKYTIVKN